ncbi:triose-phosphate isomerase [bacterium]|nr:triose-phosphate isomerase [bacterium]
MKNKLIIANWKSNPIKRNDGEKLLKNLVQTIKTNNKVIICPPTIFLSHFLNLFSPYFQFGVQNCYSKDKGPYTGEISPKMVQDIGCKYVIIGHSERRSLFNETDEDINLKLIEILNTTKITPILCIGESREERAQKKTYSIIKQQIKSDLKNVDKNKIKNIIIAYEPIWAIGTGIYAHEQEIVDAKNSIVKILCDIYGDIGRKIRIVYGGSVNAQNIESILKNADMNGVLVGGASLKPKEFSFIANFK